MMVDRALLTGLGVPPDLQELYCLSREYDRTRIDTHGRFDYSSSPERAFETAPVSAFLRAQGWMPTYPNGCSWAVCLTHDIDDVRVPLPHSAAWVLTGLRRKQARTVSSGVSSAFRAGSGSPYRNFERIMGIESRHGAKSTFFFLARSRDFHRRRYDVGTMRHVLRDIASSGWEVGLHVAYDGYDDSACVRDQKHRIEDVSGVEVLGARNHYLRFRLPESWWVASEAGLRYDSTLGFTDRVGFRNGMCHPFVPYDCQSKKSVPLLEFPLAVMDGALMRGLGTRLGARATLQLIQKLMEEVSACGGVLTLLWHNDSFASPWKDELASVYEGVLEYCRDAGAWVTSMGALCRWLESKGAA